MIRAVLIALTLLVPAGRADAAGRSVTFSSSDGTTLAGEYYEAFARPAAGVVLVHMLSRNKGDWDRLANDLQSAGLTALAIDLRGHGGSSGSAQNLLAMVQDVRAAVQWLSTRQGVRPVVGLVGASLGANLALLAAADMPSVRALALLSPALDYRGLRIDAALLKRLGQRPLWMAASTEDPFALRTLKELTSDTSGPREQRLSSRKAHGTMLLDDDEIGRAMVDWLRRTLLS